ncbi:MAG: CPBP family intramembrane glutamic endopeptidase [Candidatus Neomarinimicrobiota bacterium]
MNYKNSINNYFKHSSSLLFGVIISIPLAIYYEISMIMVNRGYEVEVRNAADALFRRLFSQLGYEGPLAGILLFAILFIVAAFSQGAHKEQKGIKIQWIYYPVLVAESLLYAVLLLGLMSISMSALAPSMSLSLVDIGYSLGAGVYEELLFRALLLNALLFIVGKIPGRKNLWKVIAVFLTAFLFSAAHYIGASADIFFWSTFLTRSLGGLLLGFVFMFRGLGPAVYTHAIYDIFVYILN